MFEPTREAALARLADFVPRAGRHYAENRNTDEGEGQSRRNVSLLSPYLRHRLITEEVVLHAVLARHSLASTEKFIQEVFWRSYFKGYLESQPQVWTRYLAQVDTLPLTTAYAHAVEGRTGIDCFDHWVRELMETGYLHNHARMWFASIWIFTLRLPWELGAAFMYHHLLDGDPASNTLSWRWVAGLHTKGKTYLARPDNIAKYTGGRFHPTGLASIAEPLEEMPLPLPQGLSHALSQPPEGHFGVLMTEEDLSIDKLLDGRAPHPMFFGITEDSRSESVSAFVQKLCEGRADQHALSDHQAIVNWCKGRELKVLATAYAPVGPTADQLKALAHHLLKEGITLLYVRRRYDSLCWPHATKGFFALKEKIPSLLGKLGIGQTQGTLF